VNIIPSTPKSELRQALPLDRKRLKKRYDVKKNTKMGIRKQ